MDAVICALRLAEAATESLSVPGLTNAVKVALRLVEMAKEIKDTKDDMRSLAEHAARTTQAIFDTVRSFEGAIDVSRTDERLDGLLSTLQRIEDVMSRTGKKRWISVILHKNDYKAELAKLEKELDQALKIFHVQGSITTDNQLSSVRHTQVELLHRADDAQRVDSELLRHAHDTHNHLVKLSDQAAANATHDGTMRLFGRDDLVLIEELDPESPVDASGAQPARYKARLRSDNSLVVVRRYPRLDDRFRDEVEVGKSIWHPNVAHAIGYSKSDPYMAFIVVDGFHTRTFNELCMTFHGPDKLKWMLKAAKDAHAGLAYLASLRDDLGWTPDEKMWPLQAERELLVSVDGRVLLDPSCYRLEHLPNTIIHDDGMIELHTRGREIVKTFKFDVEVAPAERYHYLEALWRDFVEMADFSRDESVYWPSIRIPGPGEAFSLSSEEIIPEIAYDDLVKTMTLVPEYSAPLFAQGEVAASSPPPSIEHRVITHNMRVNRNYIAKQKWRRYTVHNFGDGWTLETMTGVRESADCRGWFMNEAPQLCGLSHLLEDLAVAYALKFRTRTSLVKISQGAASRKPPRRLYFYERVHDYPHASLDPKINWPWGFWSTNPNDQCLITADFENTHTSAARQSIAFLGVSQDREFTWAQQLGDWMFYIEVRVEVEYYKLTSEECLVLQEMHRYSGDEDGDARFEEIADSGDDVGEDEDFDLDDADAWTADESDSSEDSNALEEFDQWHPDESRIAEGLEWLSGSPSMTPLRAQAPLVDARYARVVDERYARVCRTWMMYLTFDLLFGCLRLSGAPTCYIG